MGYQIVKYHLDSVAKAKCGDWDFITTTLDVECKRPEWTARQTNNPPQYEAISARLCL